MQTGSIFISVGYYVSGKIIDDDGKALSDVTIKIEGERETFLQTNKDGKFKIANVASGHSYRITPTKTDYRFDPDNINFDHSKEGEPADFIGVKEFPKTK